MIIITAENIQKLIDEKIFYWRKVKEKTNNSENREIAKLYIDILQDLRRDIFGEELTISEEEYYKVFKKERRVRPK